MRRMFVIALLFLLPLQFAWGASAGYCNHETGAAANHWGHHAHLHKLTSGDPAKAGEKGLGCVDADCSVCHLSHGSMMPAAFEPPMIETLKESYTYAVIYHSYIPSGLERPDRRLAL